MKERGWKIREGVGEREGVENSGGGEREGVKFWKTPSDTHLRMYRGVKTSNKRASKLAYNS